MKTEYVVVQREKFEKAVIDSAERFHPNLEQRGEQPDAEYIDPNIEWAWGLWQVQADTGEVERLRSDLTEMTTFRDNAANHMCRIREEATVFEQERDHYRSQLGDAKQLLHTASIRLARWLDEDDDPRKQIIAFLK